MKNKKKGVLLILDGLGDRGIDIFDGCTPLEAAHTPNMDRLISAGQGAMMDPLYPGVPVGTHTGTGILLGLAPRDAAILARGPVEAAGIGLACTEGSILIRCNFATLEATNPGYRIIDRRAGRIDTQTQELADELQGIDLGDGIRASLSPATNHRAVLCLSGPELSSSISDTDPGSGFQEKGILASSPMKPGEAAERTARALNRFTEIAYQRLNNHQVNRQRSAAGLLPANGLLCRSAGRRQRVTSMVNHFGLNSSLVAGEGTVIGLGRMLGYRIITDHRFTSLANTDLEAKVAAAQAALKESDLVFLHVKGTDICGHDRNPLCKRALIESMDRALSPILTKDLVVGITGDHSTDCNTGNHTGDPVPSLLYSLQGRRDRCDRFGEVDCSAGGLGRVSGSGFLCALLDEMGFMHKFTPDIGHLFSPAD